jgi:hypothetical protein
MNKKDVKREDFYIKRLEEKEMVTRKTWEEFRATGLLWWVNRLLHTFGWSIVVGIREGESAVIDCFPARVKFRGFSEKHETDGFRKISKYMAKEAKKLQKEAEEE